MSPMLSRKKACLRPARAHLHDAGAAEEVQVRADLLPVRRLRDQLRGRRAAVHHLACGCLHDEHLYTDLIMASVSELVL